MSKEEHRDLITGFPLCHELGEDWDVGPYGLDLSITDPNNNGTNGFYGWWALDTCRLFYALCF